MEEILFRGKRVDNGEWVEGNYYKPTGFISGVYISMDTTCANFYPDLDEESEEPIDLSKQEPGISLGKFIEVIPETVGQYTGLKDKNGKKIFEGDVIRIEVAYNCEYEYKNPSDVHRHLVKNVEIPIIFSDCSFSLDSDYLSDENTGLLGWDYIEVIGTIHDNNETT